MPEIPSPDTLIQARGVSVLHDDRTVLSQVDIAVRTGEIVTLVGPNGAGKTTLVKVLLGLVPAVSGTIQKKPGLRVGYMPQKLAIDRTLPLTVGRFLSLWPRTGDIPAVLQDVGVPGLARRDMHSLSGGEMQRVLLARALLQNPDLLVLDEPVQGVDVHGQLALYNLIDRIRTQRGCGVLMVSHDLHLVMARTDLVVCLNHHVCCSGKPHDVGRHPEYIRLFGRHAEALAVYQHMHNHIHSTQGDVTAPAPAAGDDSSCCAGGHHG
ncbi:MAG: zinc ABC transporter ATP-binding protein ZnuC [Pseudomonadota bacterium]|nr:zinc ABC transporter ATP-binding protein ZnuC [Pseudomonadota bacterium]